MFWNDGSSYKGMWQNGDQEGKGVLVTAEGLIKEGIFCKNKLVSKKKKIDFGV